MVVLGVKIALAVIALACAIFVICVVLMQSGNSDGTEALSGASKSDESETYYGKTPLPVATPNSKYGLTCVRDCWQFAA